MKKAQMQFNWAFVIIAGAVILGFFVTFTVKYIDTQNMKESAIISNDIYNMLYNLQGSSFKTDLEVPLGITANLDFTCDRMVINNFASESLKKQFIFSPKTMKTNTLNLWVQQWKYPFKISNLFYISPKEKKYYILYDEKSAPFVLSLDIPKRFNVEKITTMPNFEDKNVRLISFTSKPGDINIEPNENGKVTINNKEYPLFGMPLVYGALFSENYPCLIDKLLKRLSEIIDIYRTKADYLYTLTPNCDYSQIKLTLSTLKSKVDSKNYNEIKNYITILNEQNTNLLGNNCQPLY
ncbi:MAG: hypothetical protein PHF86_10830 [Candidatus Nanoarchaeia archaeon]|nr:hypothetical protein [Candidatus Nanoarchaeia archaeon]